MPSEEASATVTDEEQFSNPQVGDDAPAGGEEILTDEQKLAAEYEYEEDLEDGAPAEGSETGTEDASRAAEQKPDEVVPAPKEEGADEPAGDDALEAEAKSHGFSDEEIAGFKATPGALGKAMTALDREVAAIGRAMSDAGGAEAPAGKAPAGKAPAAKPESAPAAGSGKEESPAFKPFELDREKLEEQFSEEFVDIIEKVARHADPAINAANDLSKRMGEMEQMLQARADNQFNQTVRVCIDKANAAGYEEVFGKGATRDLPREGEQYKNRDKVMVEMDAMEAGYTKLGRPVPSEEVLFDRATRNLFGSKAEALARKQVTDRVEKRGKQTIQRPTRRASKVPSGEAKAIARVEEAYKKAGVGTEGVTEDDDF